MSTTAVTPNSTITAIDNAILQSLSPASQALVAIAQESKTTDSPLVKILTDVGSTTAVLASMPAAGGVLGTVEGISGLANVVDSFILGAVKLFHPQTTSAAPATTTTTTVVTAPTPVAATPAPAPAPAPAATDQSAQIAALTAQNQELQDQLAALTVQMSQLTASTPQPAATVSVPPPSAASPAASAATVSTGTPAAAPVAHTVTPNANPSLAEKLFHPNVAKQEEAAAAALKQAPVAIPTK